MDDIRVEALIGDALKRRGWTVCTAESCTGGLIAHRLTNISGSSAYVLGGVVTYSNEAKMKLIGVREATLSAHGALSAATAKAMAEGVRALFNADIALSVTGIAGPDGGTPEKPVGLVYIGLAMREGAWARRCEWSGDRQENKRQSADAALTWLIEHLKESAASATVAPVVPAPRGAPKHNAIREPSEVEAMFAHNGKVRVLRFTWKGRSWPVVSQGRQRDTGGELRTLVMTTRDRVYELMYERSSEKWFVTLASEDRLVA